MNKTLEEVVAEANLSIENQNDLQKDILDLRSYRDLDRVFEAFQGEPLKQYVQRSQAGKSFGNIFVYIISVLYAIMVGLLFGGVFTSLILGEDSAFILPAIVLVSILFYISLIREHRQRMRNIEKTLEEVAST